MSAPKPLVYLVLGAAGSGRREVVADLVGSGLDAADRAVVFASGNDPGESINGTDHAQWRWTRPGEIGAPWPPGANLAFFVTDGRANPVDQVEAVKPWMAAQGVQLARVICVVHCSLLVAHESLLWWHDACIHYADMVLLNRREGVPQKWLSTYRSRFRKRCLPCHVEMVKQGRVRNPALVLDQQVRRMSHWFDEEEEPAGLTSVAPADPIVIKDAGGDDLAEDAGEEDEYLARYPGGGRRKVIPDIAPLLG